MSRKDWKFEETKLAPPPPAPEASAPPGCTFSVSLLPGPNLNWSPESETPRRHVLLGWFLTTVPSQP